MNLKELLSSIRSRAEKATPGPWTAIPGDSYDAYPHVRNKDGASFVLYDHGEIDLISSQEDVKYPGVDADATFIAYSRTDIPLLIKIVETQAEALEIASEGVRKDSMRHQAVRYIESKIALITKEAKP